MTALLLFLAVLLAAWVVLSAEVTKRVAVADCLDRYRSEGVIR